VKLLKADKDRFQFQLDQKEKQLLFQVLGLYPLIPGSHQKLSKSETRPDDQRLLEEALAAERQRHKRQVDVMLRSKTLFIEREGGCEFALKPSQIEWLLQVLNDVRVGAWLILGSPDGPAKTMAALNNKNAHYFWAMEAAAHFQMALVRAMTGGAEEAVQE